MKEPNYLDLLKSQLDPKKNNVISCEPFTCYYLKEDEITSIDLIKDYPNIGNDIDTEIIYYLFEQFRNESNPPKKEHINYLNEVSWMPSKKVLDDLYNVASYGMKEIYPITYKFTFEFEKGNSCNCKYYIKYRIKSEKMKAIGLDINYVYVIVENTIKQKRKNKHLFVD